MESNETNEFAEARKVMVECLSSDKELRQAYLSSIAMTLYDDQTSFGYVYDGIESYGKTPEDLTTMDGCNKMAKTLLDTLLECFKNSKSFSLKIGKVIKQ